MQLLKSLSLSFFFLIALGISSYAQEGPSKSKKFNKYEAFSPLFMNEFANSYHSANGAPGPDYWQNQADYAIKATLDTVNHAINGKVTITYTNNSPHSLEFLWLQLDQNSFRADSRSKALYPAEDRNGVRTPTEGYELKEVTLDGKKADYLVNDSRMQIRLENNLNGNGQQAKIEIAYAFQLPTHGKDRMGRVETENGVIYTLAQWYPRMAVFDEVEGWNTIPYLGTGEFYLEYGDFDYEITAPENMIVVGSGVLQNPKKVLTKEQQKRLEKAKDSEETVFIVTKEEMLEGTKLANGNNGMLTWHFKMANSRDIAWAASKAFIWDGARINLPNNKKALAQSVYPAENSGQDGYARSTEYTKHAVELMSKDWFPYPYEVATNVGGHEGGMEYPGLVFCSYQSQNESLWGVINHEFGHTWFPMIVGSNERVHGWLDEGLNTFINDIATEQFNDGEYHRPDNYQGMGAFLFNESLDPIFTRADVIHDQRNLGIGAYYKPGTALHVLRNVVLGKDRFDYAFKTYINRWAYKHPQPWDFFNTMSNASGEDLGWFFKGWIMENWSLDLAAESIDYINGDYTQGAKITLMNNGQIPMPVPLEIRFEDGTSERVDLPVEIWMTGEKYVYYAENTTKRITEVEIDPDHLIPDANAGNNLLKNLASAGKDQSAEKVIGRYLEKIGGRKNLENLKTMNITMKTSVQGASLEITEKIKRPDKYLQEVKINGQSLQKLGVNGDRVSASAQGQEQPLSEEEKAYIKGLMDERFIETKVGEEGYQATLLGIDNVDGTEAYVVHINLPNEGSIKNYYATDSGLKIMTEDSQGTKSTFDDYKEVDGFLIPFEQGQSMMGQTIEMKVEKVELNKPIPDTDFE